MNFDGLADSVTNLVGALILVVILVIGVTEEAVSQSSPSMKSRPAGQRDIGTLQQQLTSLRAQLENVSKDTDALSGRLESLRTESDELFQKVEELQPPPPAKENEQAAKRRPREVVFRPPFERPDTKPKSLLFWVENRSVTLIEGPAQLDDTIVKHVGTPGNHLLKEMPFCDNRFWVDGKAVVRGAIGRLSVEFDSSSLTIRRRSDAEAEMDNELQRPESHYREQLNKADPKSYSIHFLVFPDSYEAFRAARALAWERGFDVGWQSLPSGPGFQVATGAGIVN